MVVLLVKFNRDSKFLDLVKHTEGKFVQLVYFYRKISSILISRIFLIKLIIIVLFTTSFVTKGHTSKNIRVVFSLM